MLLLVLWTFEGFGADRALVRPPVRQVHAKVRNEVILLTDNDVTILPRAVEMDLVVADRCQWRAVNVLSVEMHKQFPGRAENSRALDRRHGGGNIRVARNSRIRPLARKELWFR